MRRWLVVMASGSIAIGGIVFCACNRQAEESDALARVGSTLLTREDLDAFASVADYSPEQEVWSALDKGNHAWAFIATEAVYQKTRWSPANFRFRFGREWKWKKRYYLSRLFAQEILQRNCGYSDAEVRSYYDSHADEFRVVAYSDSGKACTTMVVPPFDSIRGDVAAKLFLNDYKPDSASMYLLYPRGFRMFRERMYRDYFVKKFYKEKYGKALPETRCVIGTVIDSNDVKIVLLKHSKEWQDLFEKDPGMIVYQLIQWKLFSEKARVTGFAAKPEVKKVLDWAWKYESARRYANDILSPAVKKSARIDTDMALYSYRDETGNAAAPIDSGKLKDHIVRLSARKKAMLFDSLIYRIRRARGVEFLKPDAWSDGRVKEPETLSKEADAFRDRGNLSQARSSYGVLAEYYPFTAQGRSALFELAKLQAEAPDEQSRYDAIKNYRTFLLISDDPGLRCEVMFRIAFMYDHYFHKKEMAEVNYRWVVKNAPDCPFSADSKVMLRHLGEHLPDVEEIRAETGTHGK